MAREYRPIALTAQDFVQAIRWSMKSKHGSSVFGESDSSPYGFLAEVAFQKMRPDAIRCDDYNFDFMSGGKKVEIKTMANRHPPKPSYYFSIAGECNLTSVEYFACFHINTESLDINYLGYLLPEDLIRHQKPAGYPLPGGSVFKLPGYRVPFLEMH